MDIHAAGDALGKLLGAALPPSYGLVTCDDCNDDFEAGEYTAEVLSRDPLSAVLCRACYQRRLNEVEIK